MMSHNERKMMEKVFSYLNSIGAKKNIFFWDYSKQGEIINSKIVQSIEVLRDTLPLLFDGIKSRVPEVGQQSSIKKEPSKTKDEKLPKEQLIKKNSKYSIDLPKFLEDIKGNVSTKPTQKIPTWKTNPPAITAEGISCRTTHILSAVRSAETTSSQLKRLEEFLQLLIQHSDAKIFAVKEGAISTVLYIRNNSSDSSIQEVIQQILPALGFADPPRSNGIRILSIDGGGMRGIAVIRMLQKIEEVTGRKIYDLFDYICGVSTGAIITCCLIPPNKMHMDQIYQLYRDMSSKVFNQSTIWGTGKLVWNHAYYDTSIWEKLLKDYVGNTALLESNIDLRCPKIAVISTVINHSRVSPFIFRNYADPCNKTSEYIGSYRHTIFEAVRASAAAPTIFEEFKTGDMLHQDGGIVVNNPAAIALHEAKTLWPDENISCIVSIGTGRYEPIATLSEIAESSKGSSSWKQIFDKILDSATDTEAVNRILNDLLPEGVYYRLNPHLSHVVTMDEVSASKILHLEEDTKMYCRRNEDKFHELAEKLIQPRSNFKKLKDVTNFQLRMLGLIS